MATEPTTEQAMQSASAVVRMTSDVEYARIGDAGEHVRNRLYQE